MNQWKKPMANRTVPEDIISDLNFWLEKLSSSKNTRLIQQKDPSDINWVGNTSTRFGIGH
jgi:hypothetical protein